MTLGNERIVRQAYKIADGKIKRCDCYPSGTVILTRLGVIGNLSAALEP